MEFLRNFYQVFPEYRHMDVSLTRSRSVHATHFKIRLTWLERVLRDNGYPIMVRRKHV